MRRIYIYMGLLTLASVLTQPARGSAAFTADDLVRLERSRFRLADRSIIRLQDRLALLSDGDAFRSCTIPTE